MTTTSGRAGRITRTVVVAIVTAAASLAAMVFRPIQATAALVIVGVAFAVVTIRSPRGGNRRAMAAGVAIGCLLILALFWTSALVNLEPDHVQDGGF